MTVGNDNRPCLMVMASTYPRWAGDPEPGFVHELSKRLVDRFRVIVLCPHAAGAKRREFFDGVEVVRYPYAPERWETLVNDGGIITNLRRDPWKYLLVPGFVLAQVWHGWRLLRRERVDVVHAHWLLPQGAVAAFLQCLPGRPVPFAITSHGVDLHALDNVLLRAIKRYAAQGAAAVAVVSRPMIERLRRTGVDVANVAVLPMGVDMDRFRPDGRVERSTDEILFVGRLVEKKGLRHLLDALPRVRREFPGARLTVVGFGPEEEALKAQVDSLGLDANVNFLGAVSHVELPDLYRRATLLVAPFVRARSGDEEGLGLVLVEALACGCPILVGDVPAMDEVLGRGYTDLRVDPTEPERLAFAITNVLANPARALAQAESLRRELASRFDWHSVSRRYADLLTTLVQPALTL